MKVTIVAEGDFGKVEIAGERKDVNEVLELLEHSESEQIAERWWEGEDHYSESKGKLIYIADMDSVHLANAAVKTLKQFSLESISRNVSPLYSHPNITGNNLLEALENREFRAMLAELAERAEQDSL